MTIHDVIKLDEIITRAFHWKLYTNASFDATLERVIIIVLFQGQEFVHQKNPSSMTWKKWSTKIEWLVDFIWTSHGTHGTIGCNREGVSIIENSKNYLLKSNCGHANRFFKQQQQQMNAFFLYVNFHAPKRLVIK